MWAVSIHAQCLICTLDFSLLKYLFFTFAYKVYVFDQFLHMLILQGLDTMNPILVLNGIKLVRNLLVKGDMDELIVRFDTISLSY